MTRGPRLQELGLPLHVIAQGIAKCAIFRDDFDSTGFILRAIRVLREMGVEVLAWALMDNHLHLVLRATDGQLSKAMQRVLGPYAQSFNRRHRRVGRLFRDRFWSRPVEDDDDLLGLIGYVILNPLRGGIVKSLEELDAYPWTSLSELISPPDHRPALVDREAVLALFGRTVDDALNALRRMIAGQYADDPEGRRHAHDEPGGRADITTRERIDLETRSLLSLRLRSARIDAVLRARETATARRMRLERLGWTTDRVIDRAVALCDADSSMLRSGSRRRPETRARSLVAHFAGVYLAVSNVAIARAAGVSRQAVNAARSRGVALAGELGVEWRAFFEVKDDGE